MKNEPWESTQAIGGKFAKICETMMKSKAWKQLSMRQRGLYLSLKIKYTKKSDGSDNHDNITITCTEFHDEYKTKKPLYDDIDALIDTGFIEVVSHGKYFRKPNIYAFSSEWQRFGTKEFFVHPNKKRMTKNNK